MDRLLRDAMSGDAGAQFDVGDVWLHFGNVTELALYWYRKAAQQGHVGAAVRLAVMLSAKSRFHHDAAEALFWCARAVVGGSREARILYPRLRRAGREGRRRD